MILVGPGYILGTEQRETNTPKFATAVVLIGPSLYSHRSNLLTFIVELTEFNDASTNEVVRATGYMFKLEIDRFQAILNIMLRYMQETHVSKKTYEEWIDNNNLIGEHNNSIYSYQFRLFNDGFELYNEIPASCMVSRRPLGHRTILRVTELEKEIDNIVVYKAMSSLTGNLRTPVVYKQWSQDV